MTFTVNIASHLFEFEKLSSQKSVMLCLAFFEHATTKQDLLQGPSSLKCTLQFEDMGAHTVHSSLDKDDSDYVQGLHI